MREVQVPLVRRHVRTLGHEAQVAEIAVIHHLPIIGLGDTIHLHGLGLVHQVEQGGK
jgi:hypothetical protein